MPQRTFFSLRSLDAQILVACLVVAANLLTVTSLLGTREQRKHPQSQKDDTYLTLLPRISITLFIISAIYFLYLAWSQWDKTFSDIPWLVLANGLVLVAACIKAEQLLNPPVPADIIISEEEA